MRVTLFTAGTVGDVRPLLALAQALQRAGCHARVATDRQFSGLVRAQGVEFAPLSVDFRALMRPADDGQHRGLGLLRVLPRLRRGLREAAVGWVTEGRAALEDTDLVIGCGMVTRLAIDLAEERGLPCVQAQLQPTTPAPDLPPMALKPPRRPWPGPLNLLLYQGLRLLAWQTLRPAYNGEVRPQLGRPPYPWYGPFFERRPGGDRILFGYSAAVLPKPAQWPVEHAVTGYWTLNDARYWQPPAALQAFLARGPKPVYVGFGSMCAHQAPRLTRTVLQALRQSGHRAVMARGWGGLQEDPGTQPEGDESVFWLDEAPHAWLLPRMLLAVHHGGAGTAAAVARAGIPSVVLPFFGDQPFWAWRLHTLGVAPPALRHQRLRAPALAQALAEAASAGMRERAAALGARLREERGADEAVAVLRQWGLLAEAERRRARAPAQPPEAHGLEVAVSGTPSGTA